MNRFLISLFLGSLMLCAGCAWFQTHGEETGKGIQAASSLLPPPFNLIGMAAGGAVAAAGAYAANRSRVNRVTAQAEKGVNPVQSWGDTGLLGRMLSERHALYPFLGVGLSLLKSTGALPISEGDLTAIIGMLGIGTAAEFHATARADKAIAETCTHPATPSTPALPPVPPP